MPPKRPTGAPKLPQLDPEKQKEYDEELQWCIYQLELGLKRTDVDEEQEKESKAVIAKFKSPLLNFIEKRQLMRTIFGSDYKELMKKYQSEDQQREELKKKHDEKKAKKKANKKAKKLAAEQEALKQADNQQPVENIPTTTTTEPTQQEQEKQ
ncbi:hypothetical protein AKO1_013189 [Acrasis kona]|uniref:Uncharacterized protein n=1 Tax=Acrasis kona TaxID=1008807 RepID=A0AAW2YXT6_9EUKA